MSGIDVNCQFRHWPPFIYLGPHGNNHWHQFGGSATDSPRPHHCSCHSSHQDTSQTAQESHVRGRTSQTRAQRVHMEEGMTQSGQGNYQRLQLTVSGCQSREHQEGMEVLKETEQQLRKNVGKLFRRRRGFSFQRIAEFFKPTSAGRVGRGRGVGMQRHWTLKAPRRLFSAGDSRSTIPEEVPELTHSPVRQRAKTLPGGRHLRTVSDVTEQFTTARDEDSSSPGLTPSATPVPGEEVPGSPFPPTPYSSTPAHQTFSFLPQKPAESQRSGLVTSIDVEVNITVNIDSGIVKLRCKEESVPIQRTSSPSLLAHAHYLMHTYCASSSSPLQPRKQQGGSANDTIIILIPALSVQVHYKSLIGESYQFPSPSSSLAPLTPHFPEQQLPNIEISPGTPDSVAQALKRGVLAVSVVVMSTPEDMTLTPSLLEFVEQVVRPTIAATAGGKADSSSDGESEEESEGEEEEDTREKTDTPPISFPVDVTIVFHMQPSRVCFSCQPHSQVHCIVCSPNVNFVVSFSLFSAREVEGAVISPTPHSVVTFNNLFVTGCLETFTLQVLSPQVSSLKQNESESKTTDKEALSLTLGQALVHLSRKSVLVASRKGSPEASHSPSKLQVSVVASIASLVLGYDMRRLNDLTAFRRYWYRTSLVESFIGSKKQQQLERETMEEGKIDGGSESGAEEAVDSSTSAAIVVLAAVEDFRLSANVAQVMGNTDLVVTHLQCQVHADVSHNELVLLRLAGRMEKGEVDARGGVVAGTILMQDVVAQVTTESHLGLIPVHSARISLAEAETRVDYMSSCILLGRASQLVVSARDLWEGLQLSGQQEEAKEANIQVAVTPLSSYRPLAVCAGVSGAVVGASAACHPENNYQVPDEHCAEDPRLSASTEKEK
ncbi:Transmembrane protein KIAA1109 homolog [Geodia barretti]|uniref:Transmembrane protein KIAA1109 homolog n=1 Tax=Geodia barretti TaxID=519541 RepID=A0AA35U0L1_GEOBA|nr:Transmembrane protein KIAA1109 homolog [Geodia barretti]